MAVTLQDLITSVNLYTSSYDAQKSGITALQTGLNNILNSINVINNRLSELEDQVENNCNNICVNSSSSEENIIKRFTKELDIIRSEISVLKTDALVEIRNKFSEYMNNIEANLEIFKESINNTINNKLPADEQEKIIREAILKFSEEVESQKGVHHEVETRISKIEVQMAATVELIHQILLSSKVKKE